MTSKIPLSIKEGIAGEVRSKVDPIRCAVECRRLLAFVFCRVRAVRARSANVARQCGGLSIPLFGSKMISLTPNYLLLLDYTDLNNEMSRQGSPST